MNNILITGGTGLLGGSLIKLEKGYNIRAVYIGDYHIDDQNNIKYMKADVRDINFEQNVVKNFNPSFVIHTAGLSNVDYCEENPQEARDSNVNGTKNMLALCKKFKSHMIYISTNAVYDGENPPYDEESNINPINIYGKVKAECEEMVKNSGISYTIVRPIIMYGWHNQNERGNQVAWIIDQLKNGNEIKMVNDVYENPLFSESAAECIWKIVKEKIPGVFNIAGQDIINRYEMANQIAEVFNLAKDLIIPVSSDFFETLAPRPQSTYFNTDKMEKVLKIKPLKFKEGLRMMKKR